MIQIIIILSLTFFTLNPSIENCISTDYLQTVLLELDKIESAAFRVEVENWQPGDTTAFRITNRYVESYRNPSDTTVGSSWAVFNTQEKTHFEFAYDGETRCFPYDEEKRIVIDSFKVRKLPFRPVSTPFFNYTESIIRYIVENNDSTSIEQKDLGEEIYLKLTIHEDRQVEFFGKAHFQPKNPYMFDPTSIYELWIDKKSNLPKKFRREMCHDINIQTVLDYEFNKLRLQDFVASNYFPQDYKIVQYRQKGKKRKPNEMIGKKAPEWTLQTDDKNEISLSDLKSKVLMIQFTSVSCGPCKASIPFLKELATEYKKDDFDFVAIECTSKNTNVLKNYMKRNDFDYKFLLSEKEVLKKYTIKAFPIFFLLDENRNIINVIMGYGKEETDKEIRMLINDLI